MAFGETTQKPPVTAVSEPALNIKEMSVLLANKSNTEMVKTLQKYGKVTIEPPPMEFRGPNLDEMKNVKFHLEMTNGTKAKIDVIEGNTTIEIKKEVGVYLREGTEINDEISKKGITHLKNQKLITSEQATRYNAMIDNGKSAEVFKELASKNLLDEFLKFINKELQKGGAGETDVPTLKTQDEDLFKKANKDLDMVQEREKKAGDKD
ncbi:MAG: hypothetical protein WC588_05005 [Candidatus Micrarchaeia archaeon]